MIDRGGVIAWATFILGGALVVKTGLKPSNADLGWSIGIAVIPALAWISTFYYVITTYESGEVVELAIDVGSDTHKATVWVLDIDADPVVYYETDPKVADSLLTGTPLQFTRAGETSTRVPKAELVDSLSESEANQVLAFMDKKYGDRMTAADVYYVMLGSPRDRVAVVATLVEKTDDRPEDVVPNTAAGLRR